MNAIWFMLFFQYEIEKAIYGVSTFSWSFKYVVSSYSELNKLNNETH